MSVLKQMTSPYSAVESWLYDRVIADAVVSLKSAMQAELVEGVPQDAQVLDVGCGGGQLALELAKERPFSRVTGVDLSHEQVARARRRAADAKLEGRVKFVQGSALELPFEDEAFDVVISIASIKHWPDPARGLAECTRVLLPGGKLVVVEADRGCRFEDAAAFVERFRLPRPLKPMALAGFRTYVAGQSFDLDEARQLIEALPLTDRRVERIPGTPGLVMTGLRSD